ncbi:MAG: acyl carrier protein [Lachnospiraceae bacterium]|nr:acyl carrier protein [Lachnospiraceae bacterium]MBO7600684.1 acyl carrier protein [Lachnospiraceae bacterium]
MTREELYENLNEVFRDVFDDESICVDDHTTADDIEDWDSLEHINLIVAIEKKFSIKFNMGEVNKFKNVGEMADNILAKL